MSGSLSAAWVALARRLAPDVYLLGQALSAWETEIAQPVAGAASADARRAERLAALSVRRQVMYAAHCEALALAEPETARGRLGEGDLVVALCTLAIGRERTGDTVGALGCLDEAVVLAVGRDDTGLYLRVLSDRARIHSVLGNRPSAMADFSEVIELARVHGDRVTEARALGGLGFVYGHHDEPVPYAAYTRQALAIFRELGDRQMQAHTLCNLGGALQRMGQLDEAEACYAEGLPVALELKWTYGESLFLAGQAGLACIRGRLDEGLARYEAANVLLVQLSDHFQIGRHLLIAARHLVDVARYEDAMPYLHRAVAHAATHGFVAAEVEAHGLFVRSHEALGDLVGANTSLHAKLALRERLTVERIEERVRTVELRLQSDAARRDAERERQRAAELQVANEDLRAALERERELMRVLDHLARTDTLTRLANRRHLQEFLAQEMGRSRRRWRPFSLVLLDIDHFKAINDRFGHAVGDEVLVEVGNRLKEALRSVDVIARWGGEEFCAGLVDTAGPIAFLVAQRLRTAIYGQPFRTSVGAVTVTASLGVADLRPGESSADELIRRADLSLYEAKRRGRNRVEGGPEHVTDVAHLDDALELP